MNKSNGKNKQTIDNDQGKTALIRGIEEDARREAQEIIAQAEKAKEERLQAREREVVSILDEAKRKAQEQVDTIKKNSASLISVDTKRQMLKLREHVIALITEKVLKKMEPLVSQDQYATVLEDWVVEAVIGLMVPEASVNASARERKILTRKLLSEAEAEVEQLTGRKVSLSLSDSPPLLDQGVMVSSSDGRTAFNNQVRTRLVRHQSEIRKLIYAELFGE